MKTILFYATNGIGLGHLRRVCLIAEESQLKDNRLVLVTSAHLSIIFGKLFDSIIRLIPLSDELFKSPVRTRETRLANGVKFAQSLKKFKPDLIVCDFYFPPSNFTFYPLVYALSKFSTKNIFIWRIGDRNNFTNNFSRNDKLDYFKKIILPHSQDELKYLFPSSVFKKIKINDRFKITGPIFKNINKKKIDFCRNKYKIFAGDFLLTVSLGGGGKLKIGKCDSPREIVKYFLSIYPRLVKLIPNLKTVISTGPYFGHFDKRVFPDLRFIKFEKNFPELIKLSNLVISPAGYNTCNELIMSETPAILIPLMRGDKEQFEKARYLEKKGIVKVFNSGSPDQFFDLIIDCKNNLDKMKSNFKNFSSWKQGNNKAAKIILKVLND